MRLTELARTPVLAIDELGKGKMSAFEQETVDELISRRYNAGKPTLFATNYTVSEESRPVAPSAPSRPYTNSDKRVAAESQLEYSLKERVGERVYSRLHQMCRFIVFPGSAMDYRRLSARV